MFTSFMPLSLLFLIYFGFILYLLRDCEFTSNCWQNLGIGNFSSEFFSLDIHSRLEENCWIKELDIFKFLGVLCLPLECGSYGNTGIEWFSKTSHLTRISTRKLCKKRQSLPIVLRTWQLVSFKLRNIYSGRDHIGVGLNLNTDASSLGNPGEASGGGSSTMTRVHGSKLFLDT